MAVAGAAEAVGPDSSRDEADESQGQRGKGALDSATGALSHRDGTSPVAASAAPEAPASSQAPGAEGARSDVTPRVEANGEPPGGGGGAADEQRGDGDSSNAARPPPPDAAQAVGGERAAGVAAGGVQNGGGGAARPSVEVSRAGSGSLLTSPPRLFPALLPDWAAAFDYSDVSSDSGDDDEGGERGAGAGGGVAASERLRRLWNEVATNLTHVVNDPRLRGRTGEDWLERSLAELDDESGTAARPPAAALGSSADLGAAITRRSFDTYVSQLRHARRGAGLAPTPRRSRGGRGASFGTDGGGASGHPMASSEAVAQVPDEFFSSSFSLRDPDTFARMLCAPAMLVWQERLSHWLDVVEMALLARIEAKSDSFFSALTTLQGLEGDVGAATRAVLTLRQHVAKLQSAGAVRGLAVLGGGRRRTNMKKALELARLLAGVSSARQLVAQLIQQEDFGGALDVIERTERLVAGRLGGVAAAEVIMRQLEQKRRLVGTTLQSGYVAVAVRLLIAGPDDGDAEANGDRNKATGARSSDEGGAQAGGGSSARAWRGAASDAVIEAELRPLLIGIARVGPTCLETALRTFQTRLLDGVHALVKTVVHESLVAARPGDAAAAEPTAPGVSRKVSPAQLKSLDANDLLDVLSSLLEALFALLRRARAAHHVVERVLDGGVLRGAPTLAGAEGDPAPSGAARAATAAPSLVDEAEEELRGSAATGRDAAAKLDRALRSLSLGVVAAAADKAQRLVARLLAARGDANETLRVADMVSMWNLCSSFADAADAVAGTRVTALRTELTGQGRRLLERVHERALQRQERLLDAELWKPTDVPVEVQAMADRLVAAPDAAAQHDGEGAAEGSGAWSNSVGSAGDGLLVRWSPPPRGSGGADARGAAGTNASGRRAVPKTHLLVGGQRFRVVGSILVMVQVLSDYATVATEMPPLAGAVVRRLAALLRRVNARTIELVLQAQARKAAGLKSITTKHLAMACQSMCVLAALVPPLRATCLLALQPHEHILLEELGGVARDIESHVDRLLDKMVAIMELLVQRYGKEVRTINWAGLDSSPSPAMAQLIKDVGVLHKVAQSLLSGSQVQDVFSRIAVMLSSEVPVFFEDVAPATLSPIARERIAADIKHLVLALQRVRGLRVRDADDGPAARDAVASPTASVTSDITPSSGRPGVAAIRSLLAWCARRYPRDESSPPPPAAPRPPSTPEPVAADDASSAAGVSLGAATDSESRGADDAGASEETTGDSSGDAAAPTPLANGTADDGETASLVDGGAAVVADDAAAASDGDDVSADAGADGSA